MPFSVLWQPLLTLLDIAAQAEMIEPQIFLIIHKINNKQNKLYICLMNKCEQNMLWSGFKNKTLIAALVPHCNYVGLFWKCTFL